MKEKLTKQFEAVPFVIGIYVAQMILMFAVKVAFYSLKEVTQTERTVAYLLVFIYYVLYFNSMYKFSTSFYNIFRNSRIDESDIMLIEITATLIYAVIIVCYSLAYTTVYQTEDNKYFGPISLLSSLALIAQCYFQRKFYIVA